MFKKISNGFLMFFIIIGILSLASCNKKDDKEKKDGDNKVSGELIKKDEKGEKADLKFAPKVNEKFRYKMTTKTSSTISVDKKVEDGSNEITTENVNSFYYTQEVVEISSSGVVTFKVKYDSIIAGYKIPSEDSSLFIQYNSNIKDSVYKMESNILNNSLIGQEFRMRVSSQGEILDIYELEKIHDNIFKAFGDTLKQQQKEALKESLDIVSEIKKISTNQFQKFRGGEIYKDSSWTFTQEASVPFLQITLFHIRNILEYKLKEFQNSNGDVIVVIDASLGIDFIDKEQKDKNGNSIKITESKPEGKGIVFFNLTKGCIVKKETSTKIPIEARISSKGQSAKASQNTTTSLTVELLQ
jgi:hypothetical protein